MSPLFKLYSNLLLDSAFFFLLHSFICLFGFCACYSLDKTLVIYSNTKRRELDPFEQPVPGQPVPG